MGEPRAEGALSKEGVGVPSSTLGVSDGDEGVHGWVNMLERPLLNQHRRSNASSPGLPCPPPSALFFSTALLQAVYFIRLSCMKWPFL